MFTYTSTHEEVRTQHAQTLIGVLTHMTAHITADTLTHSHAHTHLHTYTTHTRTRTHAHAHTHAYDSRRVVDG